MEGQESKDGFTMKSNEMAVSDAVSSLEWRMGQLKQSTGDKDLPPYQKDRLEKWQKSIRWLDNFQAQHPDLGLSDAYNELLKRSMGSLPEIIKKQEEPVLSEVGDLVIRLKHDVMKLPDSEREFVMQNRKELTSSEEEIIQQALKEGIFRTHFSTRLVSERGGNVGSVGFTTFLSANGLSYPWERGWQKVLDTEIPDAMQGSTRPPENIIKLLDNENVFDGVIIRPIYERITQEVVEEKTNEVVGMWGKKKQEVVRTSHQEFVENRQVNFPGRENEPMVKVLYQTLTAYVNEKANLFTDDNTRPGNLFLVEMFLPKSLASKVAANSDTNPNFVRKLVKSAVFNEQYGISSCLDRQPGSRYTGEKVLFADENNNDQHLKYDRGLPPYQLSEWSNAGMIMDINLDIPKEDQVALRQMNRVGSGIEKLAEQKIKGLIVIPKVT